MKKRARLAALFSLIFVAGCECICDDGTQCLKKDGDECFNTAPRVDNKKQKGGGGSGGGGYVGVFCNVRDGAWGSPGGYCMWDPNNRTLTGAMVWDCESPIDADVCSLTHSNIPYLNDVLRWNRAPLLEFYNSRTGFWEAHFN